MHNYQITKREEEEYTFWPPQAEHCPNLQVFCYTGDAAHEEMQQACFDYLRLGGWYSAGPISLLSGLRPSPSVLVMHFFAVAIFGVGRLLLPRPTFRCFFQPCLPL